MEDEGSSHQGEGIMTLVENLNGLESNVTNMLMETALRISNLTGSNMILIVDSKNGRKFAGKPYLCDLFRDGTLVATDKDVELRLPETVTGLTPFPVEPRRSILTQGLKIYDTTRAEGTFPTENHFNHSITSNSMNSKRRKRKSFHNTDDSDQDETWTPSKTVSSKAPKFSKTARKVRELEPIKHEPIDEDFITNGNSTDDSANLFGREIKKEANRELEAEGDHDQNEAYDENFETELLDPDNHLYERVTELYESQSQIDFLENYGVDPLALDSESSSKFDQYLTENRKAKLLFSIDEPKFNDKSAMDFDVLKKTLADAGECAANIYSQSNDSSKCSKEWVTSLFYRFWFQFPQFAKFDKSGTKLTRVKSGTLRDYCFYEFKLFFQKTLENFSNAAKVKKGQKSALACTVTGCIKTFSHKNGLSRHLKDYHKLALQRTHVSNDKQSLPDGFTEKTSLLVLDNLDDSESSRDSRNKRPLERKSYEDYDSFDDSDKDEDWKPQKNKQ